MKTASRFVVSVVQVLTFVALAAGPANARPVDEIKYEDVTRVLQHFGDPVPKQFLECGSNVDSVLADIVTGRTVRTEIRVRAARALGWYPGTRSRAVLASMMSNPDEDKDVRAACMFGLARLIGGAAIDEIKPWLKDASTIIRTGAAAALASIGGPRSRQILMDTISHEGDLDVRSAMDDALNRMPVEESVGVARPAK